MRCEDARLALLPGPHVGLDSSDACNAIRHYAACEACQRYFRSSRRLTERLRQLSDCCCPETLRDRTVRAVRRQSAADTPDQRSG
jgi:hypothetical protein